MRTQQPLAEQYRGQKIVVSGATGFLGSALLRQLLPMEVELVALWHRTPPRVFTDNLHWLPCPEQPEEMRQLLAQHRPGMVFHLAGSRQGQTAHERLQNGVVANFQLTHALLEASRSAGVGSFVQVGTVAEYGPIEPPFREGQGVSPVTPYAATKLAASLLTQQYGQHCGLNCCSARLFLTYGPGQGEDLFMAQLFRAWRTGVPLKMSPGEQTRDYLWVEDAVQALLLLALHKDLQGAVINVCTGIETPLKEVVALLHQLSGRDPHVELGALPYRSGEVMRDLGDPSRLEHLTGYRPSTSLAEGLRRMLECENP